MLENYGMHFLGAAFAGVWSEMCWAFDGACLPLRLGKSLKREEIFSHVRWSGLLLSWHLKSNGLGKETFQYSMPRYLQS